MSRFLYFWHHDRPHFEAQSQSFNQTSISLFNDIARNMRIFDIFHIFHDIFSIQIIYDLLLFCQFLFFSLFMDRLNDLMCLFFDWIFDFLILELFLAHESINVCTNLQTNKIINKLTKRQYYLISLLQMRQSKTASFFYVRLHLPNKPPEQIKNLVVLDPPQAQFVNYVMEKFNLTKVEMRNQSKRNIEFTIIQPQKAYFEVKYNRNQLNPKQTIELHIILSPQKQKLSLNDYFIIKFDKDKSEIHVPIICQYKANYTHKIINHRNLMSNKENASIESEKQVVSMFAVNCHSKDKIRSRNISIGDRIRKDSKNQSSQIKDQLIKDFEKKYKAISEAVKEKAVRNEVYLGQKVISSKRKQQIIIFSNEIKILAGFTLAKQLRQRYSTVYSQSGPIVQTFTNINLRWNKNKNIPQLTLIKGLSKVQQEVRKHIVNLRFQKIKGSLKYYKQYHAKAEKEHKKIKVQDYLDNLNHILQKANKTDEYDFIFNKNSLNPTNLKVQYRNDYYQQKFQFEINQRIGFDHWIPITELKPSNQEIYSFTAVETSQSWGNFEVFDGKNQRGALHEYPYNLGHKNELIQIEGLLNDVGIKNKQNQAYSCNCEELFEFSNQLQVYKQDNLNLDLHEFEQQEIDKFATITNVHKNHLNNFNTIRWWQQDIEYYFQTPYQSELQRYAKINAMNRSSIWRIIGKIHREDKIRQEDTKKFKYQKMRQLALNLHNQTSSEELNKD